MAKPPFRRETLLTASSIRLYGRIIQGLQIDLEGARLELGGNRFLREQLDRPDGDPQPALARIYGYSYYGQYTALTRPAIFLIHGNGRPASPRAPAVVQVDPKTPGTLAVDPAPGKEGDPDDTVIDLLDAKTTGRLGTGPNRVDLSGQAATIAEFAADIRVWEYDRADFSLRLDIDSGPLERILIEREDGGEEMPYFRGQRTRLRGPGE